MKTILWCAALALVITSTTIPVMPKVASRERWSAGPPATSWATMGCWGRPLVVRSAITRPRSARTQLRTNIGSLASLWARARRAPSNVLLWHRQSRSRWVFQPACKLAFDGQKRRGTGRALEGGIESAAKSLLEAAAPFPDVSVHRTPACTLAERPIATDFAGATRARLMGRGVP